MNARFRLGLLAVTTLFGAGCLGGYWTFDRFVGLGDLPGGVVWSVPLSLSGSGLRVVGQDISDPAGDIKAAFGWTRRGSKVTFWSGLFAPGKTSGGIFPLKPYIKPGDTVALESDAYAICLHETDVVGDAKSEATVWQAVRWTKTGPEALPGPDGDWTGRSGAQDVSADGSVIVGFGGDASVDPSKEFAFRCVRAGVSWHTELMSTTQSGELAEGSFAYGVSSDGNTICGYIRVGGSNYPCVWKSTTNGGPLVLMMLSDLPGEAKAASANGAVVAGTMYGAWAASYWVLSGGSWSGPISVGNLPGYTGGYVNTINEAGTLIGGYAFGPVAGGPDLEGFLWSTGAVGTGLYSVNGVLHSAGILPGGWFLTSVNDIMENSAKNQIFLVGESIDPHGDQQGWYARFSPRLRRIEVPHGFPRPPVRPRPPERFRK